MTIKNRLDKIAAALEQAMRQDCGVKSALVFEIFDDD